MPGDPFYKSKPWYKTRMKVLFRDHFKCVFCGESVRGKGKARIDHIIPRKECPELELELSNLRALCTTCDAMRHSEKGRTDKGAGIVEVGVDGLPTDPNHLWAKQ